MKFASSYEPGEYEADIYAAWEASGAFSPKEDGEKKFSIVMPPPNANGNLHIGHGLTIALEDSLTRYYRLRGRKSWYIPGADHAGFETWVVYERALEKEGHTRFEYPREELYARVWNFVEENRGNMELQLRALGASCSWKDLTFTLDENVIRRVYATFEKMWQDGMIYRGEKLVNYCTKHQTAFADIEVEHIDEKGHLWDIAYPYDGGEIIVSTTRPETLFGDTAVAVNPEDPRYKDLIGKTVHLPLTDREIPVIADEHADMEYGTGAVKITPAHDYDDFEVGSRHDLPRITVIGFDGKMLPTAGPDYAGLTTAECRKKVLKDLKSADLLRGEKEITHAVAHCYKCGTVLEPLLMKQWFINTEKLAQTAISHLENNEIKFYPASKKNVLINYLKGLKDWNISRQIPWGIAIPMFYCKETDEWLFDTRTDLHEIEVAGKTYIRDEDTFDTWFSSSHWPIVCTDWEEGVPSEYYPLNVMETGADILFAWVARMIMMGLYVTGEVPFKEVYLHGLVLDAHGQKMSKSKGNVINPMDMVGKYGSDAFRMGILRGRSAGMNQAFSENSVIAGRNLCNKLWNISRFIQSIVDEGGAIPEVSSLISNEGSTTDTSVDWSARGETSTPRTIGEDSSAADVSTSGSISSRGNTIGRAPVTTGGPTGARSEISEPSIPTTNLGEDWIARELDRCRSILEQDMAEYRFADAVETLYSTIWDKYADWFIESQKLYKNTPLLKSTLEMILIMLHPFAPFVTEAIWQNLSWTDGMIIDAKWPPRLEYDPISAENFERLTITVSEVRATLQSLSGLNKGKKYGLLYGDDSLINDNSLLVQYLTKAPSINPTDGAPRGLRIATPNTELYLDVPEEIVNKYRNQLEERILAVGRELDALNARMMNPNYVEKAPAGLVKETRDQIAEKEDLISRLKTQLEVI